jgi:16S rRNA (cytosine1402-N4)-methyltransferase
MQLDRAERGFSFRANGPLDMRMSSQGESAADVVNRADEKELADIFYYYGEEKNARRIARAIVAARTEQPISNTLQLAEIIRSVSPKSGKTDPSTRSFQALRIYVNHEFDEIESGLQAAERLLASRGRLVVVSFHSLEDRIVKRFTHSRCGKLGEQSRHQPRLAASAAPRFFLPKPEKQVPSKAELERNPRARSATMRMMEAV